MLCCSCSSWSASCLLAEDLDRDVAGDSCLGMGGLRLPRGELSEELRLTLRTVAQPDPMQTGLKSGGLAVKTKAVLAGCEEIPQSSATALRVPQRTALAPGRSSLGTSAPPRHRLSPVREAALRSARLCMEPPTPVAIPPAPLHPRSEGSRRSCSAPCGPPPHSSLTERWPATRAHRQFASVLPQPLPHKWLGANQRAYLTRCAVRQI